LSSRTYKVLIAQPEYLLAMKSLACRIGEAFHDEEDVRYLLRLLDIRRHENALQVITRFYPLERFPRKTRYALAQLLPAAQSVEAAPRSLAPIEIIGIAIPSWHERLAITAAAASGSFRKGVKSM
jgi:hypothetical protein